MFAIVQSGGKQYRVSEGDVLRLESLQAEPGDTVDLPVMLLGGDAVQVGTPLVDGASVRAEVLSHGRGDKITVYKFKAKSNYRRKNGHRQHFTEVRITEILGAGGGAEAAAVEAAPPPAEATEPAAEADEPAETADAEA